ncbi:hypothetical protein HDU84_009604, partial [Entophlyctis sp. JEL0112]
SDPDALDSSDHDPHHTKQHLYSRVSQATPERVEKVLSALCGGHAVTYSSGQGAAYAATLLLCPKRVAIRKGFNGIRRAFTLYKPDIVSVIFDFNNDLTFLIWQPLIDIDDELEEGDLVWLETPLNPTGEVLDICSYAARAHSVGAKLAVDGTFAPPPLSFPMDLGADVVLYSATKCLGGHSDLLGGVLIVRTSEDVEKLLPLRTCLGLMMGSMESWLLLRSLRMEQQSKTTVELVQWLQGASDGKAFDGIPANAIRSVHHSSIQIAEWDISRQMSGGHGTTFSIVLETRFAAERLAHRLQLFYAATSLGGVESLAEWRHFWDKNVDERLVRLSIGLEDVNDLKEDLRQALQ